jgi:Sulfotransferase family
VTVASDSRGSRAPDFYIVGHHKSGTTALYEMLRRHPQIFMPELKEPRYFASDLRAQFEPVRSGRLPETLEQYLALFADAREGQLTGEASPSYLRSTAAASAIAQLRPDARIIAILREPASFVRSLHLQLVQDHVETEKELAAAFAAEERVRDGRRIRRYSDHIRYTEQIGRYADVFAPEQILVLIYDDFRADNEAVVRRTLRFLGVDDTVPIPMLEANPTVRVRSLRLDSALGVLTGARGPVGGAVKRGVKAVTPERLHRGAASRLRRRLVYGEPAPVDEQVMRELRRHFKDEVAALSEYLGRDLVALWGYDDLD